MQSKNIDQINRAGLVKKHSDPESDWNKLIDYNSALKDCLERLSYHKLHKDDYDYLYSQLRNTPGHIIIMLKRIGVYGEKEKIKRFLDTVATSKSSHVAQDSASVLLQKQKKDTSHGKPAKEQPRNG